MSQSINQRPEYGKLPRYDALDFYANGVYSAYLKGSPYEKATFPTAHDEHRRSRQDPSRHNAAVSGVRQHRPPNSVHSRGGRIVAESARAAPKRQRQNATELGTGATCAFRGGQGADQYFGVGAKAGTQGATSGLDDSRATHFTRLGDLVEANARMLGISSSRP